MMGEPAAFVVVNDTQRQNQGHVPRPDNTRASPQQFWAGFWTERLQALKRHIENAQASSSGPAPSAGPAADVSR